MTSMDPAPFSRQAPEAAQELLRREGVARIFNALDADGEEIRIVGGALRNALFERPVHEIDFAATATPETIMARANAAGLRCIPTGISHGTVTLLVAGETFEVTSLREDVETDGRRAKVRFGRNFEADALRRDFTMNALYLARSGALFDYVGGLKDIEARKVRFIGDPDLRIREDYLRILRFFRFSAEFGEGPLDRAGLLAAIRAREGLAGLSRERVRAELLKLLCARRAGEIAQEMSDAGLLAPLLGLAPRPARLKRLALGPNLAKDSLLALAALCVELPEDAERLREALRLSNAELRRLERAAAALMKLHGRKTPPDPDSLRALIFRFGREAALDAAALAEAEAGAPDAASWRAARDFLREAAAPRLPFTGEDLVARGFGQGRAIGETLRAFQERWIREGFPEGAEQLNQLLDEAANASK